jgi:DNA mismatch endonuclease (patch repair protein)
VIFVHGCWWHRHNCRLGRRSPKSKKAYWTPKLRDNKERHKKNQHLLKKQGWKVLTIWECQTTSRSLVKLTKRIMEFLEERNRC